MTVTLRPAGPADEARLLEWRNDPAVRAASFSSDEVSPDAHHRWYGAKLAEAGTLILIVEADGDPVGQVRLERAGDGTAEVHIGLGTRGRGIGREALRQAVGHARRWPDVEHVRALVKPGNEPSLKAFRAAGFEEHTRSPDAVELRAVP